MSAALWEGDIFAGKYRVDKVLGQGGMGMVLGAHHLGLDEPVAIKVLLPAMLEIPGMVERFLREAKAAAKIKNEHVARVTDVDALPSGVPYIVMERLEGLDLAALCKQKKRLSIQESARYLLQACEAIGEAHELGIIHRDLKPGNIFLAKKRDGSHTIKVLDFGISKLTGVLAQHQATTIGTVLGSPSYMSPEQMASAPDVDGRTDIWAIGAILYQLTTGELPFKGDTLPQICTKVLQAAPERPTELHGDFPQAFEALILRCLEKDRAARFANVGELMAALRPFSDLAATPATSTMKMELGAASAPLPQSTVIMVPTQRLSESIVSSTVTMGRPQAPTSQRSGRMILLGGAGVLTLLAAGGLATFLGRTERSPSSALGSSSSAATTSAAAETVATTVTTHAPPPASTPTPSSTPLPGAPSATASASAAPSASTTEKPAVATPPDAPSKAPVLKTPAKPIKAAAPPTDDPFAGNQK